MPSRYIQKWFKNYDNGQLCRCGNARLVATIIASRSIVVLSVEEVFVPSRSRPAAKVLQDWNREVMGSKHKTCSFEHSMFIYAAHVYAWHRLKAQSKHQTRILGQSKVRRTELQHRPATEKD